jgi:small GTP-binding protein
MISNIESIAFSCPDPCQTKPTKFPETFSYHYEHHLSLKQKPPTMSYTFKILLMGDFGCGKTSLVRRFVENSFSEKYLSTIGVSMSRKSVTVDCGSTSLDATMIIWDIEGDTLYRSMTKQYIMGAHGVIVVGDLTRPQTLDSLSRHLGACFEYDGEMPVCIALNKSDLPHEDPSSRLEALLADHRIAAVRRTSAKEGTEVDALFKSLLQAIFQRNGQC